MQKKKEKQAYEKSLTLKDILLNDVFNCFHGVIRF